MIDDAMNIIQVFVSTYVCISLWVEMLGHMVNLSFEETARLFSKVASHQ